MLSNFQINNAYLYSNNKDNNSFYHIVFFNQVKIIENSIICNIFYIIYFK